MCDLLAAEQDQIIKTDDNTYSKTEILNQTSNEDENAKDSAPEVIGKSDAGIFLKLFYILRQLFIN